MSALPLADAGQYRSALGAFAGLRRLPGQNLFVLGLACLIESTGASEERVGVKANHATAAKCQSTLVFPLHVALSWPQRTQGLDPSKSIARGKPGGRHLSVGWPPSQGA